MGANTTEFETFEQQLLDLMREFQTITISENRLRDELRAESIRAEAAVAARDETQRAEAEARSSAAAASAATAQASTALAKAHDDLAATKMQFELAERHRVVLEDRCSEMSIQVEALNKELQKLRPLQTIHSNLQRQFTDLQERIHTATCNARREKTHLESELRRVEKCAGAGAEIRDRARLAAAAHVRERRLAAAELQHTSRELHNAKAEITKLGALVAELRCRLSQYENNATSKTKNTMDINQEALAETRAALEAERAGSERLEQALAAAIADNATLAETLHSIDNADVTVQPGSPKPTASNLNIMCPIDSFLAE